MKKNVIALLVITSVRFLIAKLIIPGKARILKDTCIVSCHCIKFSNRQDLASRSLLAVVIFTACRPATQIDNSQSTSVSYFAGALSPVNHKTSVSENMRDDAR